MRDEGFRSLGELVRAGMWLRINCQACRYEAHRDPAPLLARWQPRGSSRRRDVAFAELEPLMRCMQCGKKGAVLGHVVAPKHVVEVHLHPELGRMVTCWREQRPGIHSLDAAVEALVSTGLAQPDAGHANWRLFFRPDPLADLADRGDDVDEGGEDVMCNRYRASARDQEIAAAFGAKLLPEYERLPPPELFPKTPAWIVRTSGAVRIADVMPWGVPTQVPGKRIDKATGRPMMLTKDVTNVRNLASPFWRSRLTDPTHRCLVPVTSFSEYGQVRGADGKLPLHWFDVPSRPLFAFAGIWRGTEAGPRFAFLTTEPNPLVAQVHPKAMPVIVDDDGYELWLRGPWEEAQALVAAYPSQLMATSSV